MYTLFFLIIQLQAFGTKQKGLDHTKALGTQLANKQVLFFLKAFKIISVFPSFN